MRKMLIFLSFSFLFSPLAIAQTQKAPDKEIQKKNYNEAKQLSQEEIANMKRQAAENDLYNLYSKKKNHAHDKEENANKDVSRQNKKEPTIKTNTSK